MRRFFVITGWEFVRHFKSRSFLIATLITPLFLVGFIIVPTFYIEKSQSNQDQVIGCVELDTTRYSQLLSERMIGNLDYNDATGNVLIEPIYPDTTEALQEAFYSVDTIRHKFDSLVVAYNKIKQRRRFLFQGRNTAERKKKLDASYTIMLNTRERMDLAEIQSKLIQQTLDSLMQSTILYKADSLLKNKRLSGYLVVTPQTFVDGIIEFHSEQPLNFLRLQPLEQALQVILVEERMRKEGITVNKIQKLMSPIIIQEMLLDGTEKHKFKFVVTYLPPVIAVILLFISLLTINSYLYNTIVSEKNGEILESILGAVSQSKLLSGKIFGLWLLGVMQILIWMSIIALLVFTKVIFTTNILLLTLQNAGIFLGYYSLGFLFFSAIFVSIAALSASEKDAYELKHFVRLIYAMPFALIVFAILSPEAILSRFLSFIPFLTPSFMVLRTPLGQPPIIDYYISAGLMMLFIVLVMLFMSKIFRAFSLRSGKKISFKTVLELLKAN